MSESNVFETNLNALAAISPAQADKIREFFPKVRHRLYPVVPCKRPYLNVSVPAPGGPGHALFVTGDPEAEIAQWLEQSGLPPEPFHAGVLIGFGLGFHPAAVRERLSPNGALAIVEPDPLVFFSAFQGADLSDLLQDKRIHLVIGQSAEKAAEGIGRELKWDRFLALPHYLLTTPLANRAAPDFVRHFAALWRDALNRERMYRRARIEHGSAVVGNTVANARSVIDYPGVDTLFGQFKDTPAALVAAGPSLERTAAHLKRFEGRLLTVCVNTAYPVLRKHGVEPALVVAMDHHERNVLSFREYPPTPNTYLIADPRVDPAVIRRFHPRVFIASWRTTTETPGEPMPVGRIPSPQKSGNTIFAWLQELFGAKGDVYGSGSVAVAAFHILGRMGCSPVILVGQDMAYPSGKHYAEGTIFDDPNLPRDAEITHEVPAAGGGTVQTSATLNLYRQLLEHEIARFNLPVFNTSSGAAINGAITSSLLTLAGEIPAQLPDLRERIEHLRRSHKPRHDAVDLQRALSKAVRGLHQLYADARAALNEIPPDLSDIRSVDELRRLYLLSKEAIEHCRGQDALAFDLLNELMQESHFKFEDAQWRGQLEVDDKTSLENRVRDHTAVLDELVKQSNFLVSILEEEIERLDR